MPHTPATHLTITPEHIYINGEPISVMKDTLELSNPSPVELQTVTLTIIPTSVTILNDDDSKVVNAVHKAVAHHTREETNNNHSIPYAWKLYDQLTKDNREDNTDNTPEEYSGLSEIYEKYLKTQKRTLTTTKQHEWMNEFKNRR